MYNAVDYYTSRGSYVFTCFVDLKVIAISYILVNKDKGYGKLVMRSGHRHTARRLIIFRRTCRPTPAILFWAYSYAGPSNFGRFGQMLWRIIPPYALNGSPVGKSMFLFHCM